MQGGDRLADMDHQTLCDLLIAESPTTVAAFRSADPAAEVPSCPDWTVADLARHLGGIHRWVEHVVRTRAQQRETAPKDPDRPAEGASADEWADWLDAGLRRLTDTLSAADGTEPVWCWGDGTDVAWWSRRQLHETIVHRIDAQLAAGAPWSVEPAVAVDAIDEHLANIAASAYFSSGVANLTGEGSLHLHATDAEGEWMITLTPNGFEITHEHGKGTVAARGEAQDLLAAVTNRGKLDELEVFGDVDLLQWWVTNSALQ